MTAYVLAPEAVHDLHDLWDCIAADHVMDTLFAAFAQLGALVQSDGNVFAF